MRAFIAFLLIASFDAPAAAKEASLIGIWKSDRALTVSFAESHNKLEPKTAAFWRDLVGRMTISVSKKKIESRMPAFDVSIEGKAHHMGGFSGSSPYRIVHSDQGVVVAVANNPVTGVSEVTTYNFLSPDVFWIYTGRGTDTSPGGHFREYFRRVRSR